MEKLHLCHLHIDLSLFSQEKDLSPWALGESWHLITYSHIHSLCLIGNLSRTSPFASLCSSKTSHYLWTHFSEGSERLVTLRPVSPCMHSTNTGTPCFKKELPGSSPIPWAPAEQGLVQLGAAGTDLVPFPG